MQISEDEKLDAKAGRRAAGQDPIKRAQILDGAKRCFLSLGFEAASMNEITTEAGVSKGTLYVYFEDKQDLFKALIDREKSAIMSAAQHKLEEPGSIPEALHRFGAYVTSRMTSDEVIRAQRMVLGVADRFPEIAARFFTGESFTAHQILQRFLDEKVAAGQMHIDDTDLASRQFLELAMASIYKRRLFGSLPRPVPAAEIDRIVQSGVAIFMKAYGPDAG